MGETSRGGGNKTIEARAASRPREGGREQQSVFGGDNNKQGNGGGGGGGRPGNNNNGYGLCLLEEEGGGMPTQKEDRGKSVGSLFFFLLSTSPLEPRRLLPRLLFGWTRIRPPRIKPSFQKH